MTKPMTARNVYMRAMASVKVPKGMMLSITAIALREAEARKSKDLLEMAEAALFHVNEGIVAAGHPTPQEALDDIAMKGDPKHVQVKIIETAIAGVDELLANGDTVTHWTKLAVRERLKAFLAMLVNGKGVAANGNVDPLTPPPDLHKEAVHDYRILGQVITLTQCILREYRRDGDHAVEKLKAVMDAHKDAAEGRADTAVRDFLEASGDDIRAILIGVEVKSPNGKSKWVLRKGAPTWAEFDQCLAAMNDKWIATARSFVAACPVERLPDGASFLPVAPEILPEKAQPQFGRWERIKFSLRLFGLRAGLVIGGVGVLAALAYGFDLSMLPKLPDIASFAFNVGSWGGIGSSVVGALLAAWAGATGKTARRDLADLFVTTLAAQAGTLKGLLTAAYGKSADDTVAALVEMKRKEIATESDIINRISETASQLSVQVEPVVLSGEPAHTAHPRRSA